MNPRTPSRTVLISSSMTWLPRHRGERDVELEVEVEQLGGAGRAVGLVGERAQLGEPSLSFARARGGEARELAAEDPAELEEVADQLGLATGERQQVLDQLDAAGLHEVLDARAVALADPHEAEVLELLQRLAQRRAVDAQPLRQLALRRQLATRAGTGR